MARKIPLERFDDLPVMAPQILQEPDNRPSPDFVRLNLNENPLPPSPNAIAAMREAIGVSNRYPDHSCSALAKIISVRTGISPERIVFGNGSGEMLFAAAAIAVENGDQAVPDAYLRADAFEKASDVLPLQRVLLPVQEAGVRVVDGGQHAPDRAVADGRRVQIAAIYVLSLEQLPYLSQPGELGREAFDSR